MELPSITNLKPDWQNVIVIANLKPAKLRGIESRGMVLAASDGEGNLVLADAPALPAAAR